MQGTDGLLFNAFASQQSHAFSADGPHISPAVTVMPQPSLLPSGSVASVPEAQPAPSNLTIRLRRTLRVAPNRVCCNALLAAYARARHPQWAKALVLLGAMWEAGAELAPDTVSYNAVLKACGSARQIATAMQVYQAMVHRGVRPSIATFGTLIAAASDAGDLDAVQIAWGWLESSGLEANSTCMNAVVGALARGSAWRPPRLGGGGFVAGGGAFAGGGILSSRSGSGAASAGAAATAHHPSVAAAANLMSYHLQQGQYQKVREVLEELAASGLTPSLAVWNTLLAGLAAQGAWLDALTALRQMVDGRNATSYKHVLDAIALAASVPNTPVAERAVMAAEALAVFRAALGAPGAALDASCFRAVASVLDAAGDWQQAVSVFEVMAARGFVTDTVVAGAAVHACAAAGQVARGLQVLAAAGAAIEPGAANALLAAAATTGACDTAMHVFNTMHAAQAEVDAHTAAALLRALQAGAHADAARAVIDMLASPLGGRPPRPDMWPVLVAACEAARDWHRALELALCMEECGVAPDTDTLNCVLLALKAGEQPDLVLSLVQHMKTRGTAVPDAATYRTAVDTMVAAGNYAAAAALCGDAHEAGTFCHYTLPPINQGVLTVDLQSCSMERGLVVMIAFVMRAALLPLEHLSDVRIFIGFGAGVSADLHAAIEALLHGNVTMLPAGMAEALPAVLPPLAFTIKSTDAEGTILEVSAAGLRAWLPEWAAKTEDSKSQGTAASAAPAPASPSLRPGC